MKITFVQLLIIPILAFTLLSSNCKEEVSDTNMNVNVNASIKLKVATRGSYQYLIKTDTETYMSENLPKEFQEDKLEIILDYRVLDKKVVVYKPGPTDIPQEDYRVNLIDIIKIRKK